MGINLKGFATGFAKTLATRIEDEREKEEKILSNRFNLAASNRLTRQKEAAELRKVYETRVKNFNSAYPMATEQQIAAAISTETNYDTLMKAHEEGFSDDEKANVLSNYVKVGEMPETFTTAMDLVEQRVQPQVGEVKQAKRQTNKLLGFIDVSPGERTRQKYADQYGVGADELDAYAEGAAPVSDLGSMGSVSSEFLKAPETVAQRVAKARSSLQQAELSGDTIAKEEAQKIISAGIAAESFGKPYNLKEEVDIMKSEALKLKDSADPAEVAKRKAIESQIMYLENLGKKETTGEISTQVNSLAGRLRRTVSNVAADMMPAGTFTMVGDQLIPTALVEGDISIKAKKAGFSQALAVLATEGLVNSAGKLLSPTAKSAWLAAGGKIGEGDIALVPDIGNTGTATGGSTGGTPPPPASRTGQSTQPLMSAEDIIKERELADEAVLKNVDRATVAAAFKNKTGVDY